MIEFHDINLSLGSRYILKNLNWHIKTGKKIGLIGPNGTGKTTLLNLITGAIQIDSGNLSIPNKSVIGYLPQEVQLKNSSEKLLEEALSVFDDLFDLEAERDELINNIAMIMDENSPEYTSLTNRISSIEDELKARDFVLIESRTEKMLMGLGFDTEDFDRPLSDFSGGWRMRVELAKLLLMDPDLLLLDEPTNHLDIESIEWLEKYLNEFDGTVVLVSHDKYFLDRMVDTIAELLYGQITEYAGNYTSYLDQRESRLAKQVSAYENQQEVIKQYERFIERFRYKNTKARQVQSRIKMLQKMDTIDPIETNKVVTFRFPETIRSGKTVLQISQFSKSYYQTNKIFDDSEPLLIERGDKIALIGKNGIGKSTLIRMIFGIEDFDGERKIGHAVKLTYFAQNQTDYLNGSNTIIAELLNTTDSRTYNETAIRTILGSFLFSGDDVYKKIQVLSGGEKSRVALAKCLLSPKNFLILDEPTNHLDMQSRSVLIEALNKYKGTYIIVSHDRYFLDQVCNKIWYISNKKVHTYPGKYSDYMYHRGKLPGDEPPHVENSIKNDSGGSTISDSKAKKRAEAEKRNKYFNILKEKGIENFDDWVYLTNNQLSNVIIEIESIIEGKEARKNELELILLNEDIYKDVELSRSLSMELDDINSRLNIFYAKWDDVSMFLQK